ncbi:transaldolase [Buchnera aphidicola (Kurisakia onigurumii)]|uniref:transaldolase n=1 Tax=Buchnera aphidicola TaxID=9 RepID=UPI0031B6A9E7
MNQLDFLKTYSTVVVDTGNMESINKYNPQDATTNPSLILQSVNSGLYNFLIEKSVVYAKKLGGSKVQIVRNAVNKLSVCIGVEILKKIPGKISTEVNASFSFHYDFSLLEAKKIINMYEEEGIDRSRILIKLAATWQCIQVAKELKKYKINSNLTLLFSFAQAKACAQAKVYLISPFVGRILDWYMDKGLIDFYSVSEDPGVLSVKKIFDYYKNYGYKTIIMAASFRNKDQVLALSGCDYLTVSPVILNSLQESTDFFPKNLINLGCENKIVSNIYSESDFLLEHNEDAMAVEKLSDGIRKFIFDQNQLELIIQKYI